MVPRGKGGWGGGGGQRWRWGTGAEKLCLGRWVHNAVCKWCFLELYTGNLYGFVNQCHASKFKRKKHTASFINNSSKQCQAWQQRSTPNETHTWHGKGSQNNFLTNKDLPKLTALCCDHFVHSRKGDKLSQRLSYKAPQSSSEVVQKPFPRWVSFQRKHIHFFLVLESGACQVPFFCPSPFLSCSNILLCWILWVLLQYLLTKIEYKMHFAFKLGGS